MKLSACRALAILSVAVPISCSAATGVSGAVVTEHDGRPCFGTGDAVVPSSGYEAEFCLKPEAGGHVVVHQVQRDKKLNRKSLEGCRAARQP